MTSYCICHVDF